MQRIVIAILGAVFFAGLHPTRVGAQPVQAEGEPNDESRNVETTIRLPTISSARAGQRDNPPADFDELLPLLPPGISDLDIELYGKLACLWTASKAESRDGDASWNVVEVQGDFSARMGQYSLASSDAVIWFRQREWTNPQAVPRRYLDLEVFLWQGAEIIQPAGTVERGPALLVTLRTFGTVILNVDSQAAVCDADSDLYREGMRARGLLDLAPASPPDEADMPLQVSPTLERLLLSQPKPAKLIQFSVDRQSGQLYHEQHGEQSVFIAIDDVIVSQGSPTESGEYLELRADAAVLYLKSEKLGDTLPGAVGREPKPKKRRGETTDDLDKLPDAAAMEGELPPLEPQSNTPRQAVSEWVSAVYLEGDVVLTRGQRMIRASRLYYDFDADRALILDAVMRAMEPSRGLPIYVRSEQVRQLSSTEYEARNAQITTSEFHTPHVAIGASKVFLEDRTPRDESGKIIGVQAGTYKAYNTTLNVEGAPLAYWPFSRGDFARDRMAFRGAKFGYNSDFGATFETDWYMFNLFGLQQPEGYDATLKLDYFTDRGPGVGINMDYERDDYFGLLRTYYIKDSGEDDLGPDRGGPPDHEHRGRALWRHRQYLPRDWELSIEAAYISDDNFLESFERNEWENAKDQETALYLLKRQDNWQFSTLANWRINEFLTQTEHLPDAMFSLIGEPLADFATFYHESRAGAVRYRPDNRRWINGQNRWDNTGETGAVVRGDTREELQFPLPDLGPLKLTPFMTGRATGWDDSPDSTDGGGIARYFASYGIQGNMMFSKVDDSIESELLDLHRMRHVIKADFAGWSAHTNREPLELTPFDPGVEDIDDFAGATLGLRQRFQTKRGGPGKWRTVDWITFDVEAGFFSDPREGDDTHGDYISHRPEDSISSNFLAMNFQYRISDSTVVVYDGVYDMDRGNMGNSNISLAVEREPRLAYFVGWRYIHDTNNSLIGAGANYKLSEKHTVGIREYYDIEEGRSYSTEIVYVRRWPRWYTAVAFDVDRSLDDIGINFSIWPEGAPRLGLGSKRYTGLADSVGIKP
ncbi:MAG: hypothetical protein ABII12_17820 [Planctomycetota bacterium]